MHLLVSEKKGSVLAGIVASLFLLFSLKSPSPLLNKIILTARLLKMLAVLKRVSKNYLVPFELGFGPMQKSTGRAWPGSLSGAGGTAGSSHLAFSGFLHQKQVLPPPTGFSSALSLCWHSLPKHTEQSIIQVGFGFFSFSLCS